MLSRSLRCLLPGDGRARADRDIALDNPYLRGVPIGCPSVMAVPRMTEGRHEGGSPQNSGGCPMKRTALRVIDRKSTRLNSSHGYISYAVFCLKKKKKQRIVYAHQQ